MHHLDLRTRALGSFAVAASRFPLCRDSKRIKANAFGSYGQLVNFIGPAIRVFQENEPVTG